MQLVSLILNCWIVTYPMDSAIQRLNNWGKVCMLDLMSVSKGNDCTKTRPQLKNLSGVCLTDLGYSKMSENEQGRVAGITTRQLFYEAVQIERDRKLTLHSSS